MIYFRFTLDTTSWGTACTIQNSSGITLDAIDLYVAGFNFPSVPSEFGGPGNVSLILFSCHIFHILCFIFHICKFYIVIFYILYCCYFLFLEIEI